MQNKKWLWHNFDYSPSFEALTDGFVSYSWTPWYVWQWMMEPVPCEMLEIKHSGKFIYAKFVIAHKRFIIIVYLCICQKFRTKLRVAKTPASVDRVMISVTHWKWNDFICNFHISHSISVLHPLHSYAIFHGIQRISKWFLFHSLFLTFQTQTGITIHHRKIQDFIQMCTCDLYARQGTHHHNFRHQSGMEWRCICFGPIVEQTSVRKIIKTNKCWKESRVNHVEWLRHYRSYHVEYMARTTCLSNGIIKIDAAIYL